mmetsp:Transcript_18278/g.17403  ORF Transcript_18278/g.17403 Transcript_18278/m.17403 type:complete len:127 (+) Transcript_18278:1161-1541(+)
MPMLVLLAKLTPPKIEATVYAFLASTTNFCSTVISPFIGGLINTTFVGVTNDDMSNFYLLILISAGCIWIPLLFMDLVPLRHEMLAVSQGYGLLDSQFELEGVSFKKDSENERNEEGEKESLQRET